MDILSGVNGESLKALTWLSAIATGLPLGFWRPRRVHWPALGPVLDFAVATIAAGLYVLSNLGIPGSSRLGP